VVEAFAGQVPTIHPLAWVHESAVIIGDVALGEHVSVWPTAVLRGDMGPIHIGAYSNVQDGAVCHDTTGESTTRVGDRCTIGHRAILHGCVIEDDVLIGMGAIVMDNAVIGRGSVVGAGAVVTAGRVVPAGSLVLGVPGRVVRPVTAAEADRIDQGWRTYAAKCAVWRAARG
jgi:carbonic anhydrase/acetyltransferase-like protein (isoleucine patch superfamily)